MGDHTESIQIDYDPTKTTYENMLDIFWSSHNPCSDAGCRQYMSALWYHDKKQKVAIKRSKKAQEKKRGGKKVVSEISRVGPFTLAEDYHQKFYLRQHDLLVTALGCTTDEDFVNSFPATRMNAYVAGKGDLDQLLAEIDQFGLNEEAKEYLISRVKNRSGKPRFCA